jgi:hypothetical protein
LSTWLERVGAAPDPDLERYSRRILIGLVARALSPGVKFDYVPVFEGPTGVGKSTFVELLVTRPYWAVLSEALGSKDAKIALRGKWGLELAEMSAFKKSDEEMRKAFFSTASDSFRPPYGRANIDVAALRPLRDHRGQAVPLGPPRQPALLAHPLPREMDLKWFESHRDLLFAEALHAYELGERFHDTTEEMQSPERLSALQDRLVTPAWQLPSMMEHLKSLPAPHLPSEDAPGHSGILTTYSTSPTSSACWTCRHPSRTCPTPSSPRSCAAPATTPRPQLPAWGKSAKTYGWAHPALLRLTTEEQSKAFLSFFPALFPQQVAPNAWVEHRVDHLDAALRHLPPVRVGCSMPPRRQTAKTGQKHEMEAFAEKYDTLAMIYGDPVETIFHIMLKSQDEEVKLRAAEMLMSYRYPRVKAAEGNVAKAPVLNFNVTMPHPELPVNAAPARKVLSIVEKSSE